MYFKSIYESTLLSPTTQRNDMPCLSAEEKNRVANKITGVTRTAHRTYSQTFYPENINMDSMT